MGLVEETLLTAGMHRPVMRNDTEIDIDRPLSQEVERAAEHIRQR